MQIKNFAKLTGVSSATIRFYEKIGIIPKASRARNGYRDYPEERVVQFKMIYRAKSLGFTLKEIKELSTLIFSKRLSRKDMAKHLKKKNEEIDFKIKSLQKMKSEISKALMGLCEFKDKLR